MTLRYGFDLPGLQAPACDQIIHFSGTNDGFAEQTTAHFRRPAPGDWVLRIDDEPLALVETDHGHVWTWTPGFYAGEVTAELVPPGGGASHLFLLDVAPNPHKLGRDTYADMVQQIWDWDPELVLGSEPASREIGSSGDHQGLLIAFARLRRHAPAALDAFARITREPIRRLYPRREQLPLSRIRRIDRATLASLVREPGLAAALNGTSTNDDIGPDLVLNCPGTEQTLDCAPNRSITAACRHLLTQVRMVQQQMQEAVDREQEDPTRTALAARWPVRRRFLIDLSHALIQVLRLEPYAVVTRPEITAAGLNAIAAHPTYARAYRHAWLAYTPGVEGPPTADRLWISPTWEVFERWCFVRMLRALEEIGDGIWRSLPSRPMQSQAASRLDLATDRHLTLLLQPGFPAADQAGTGHHSISGSRIPDIVLLIESAEACRWFVFDAKYRSTRPNLLDAMTSAHIYHDALRYRGAPPEQALLLAPATQGVDWLLDANFQTRHGVGIVRVGVKDGWDWLPALLQDG
jgi:hypothetical protein